MLPNDIFKIIISYCDLPTARNLIISCKLLHKIGQPILNELAETYANTHDHLLPNGNIHGRVCETYNNVKIICVYNNGQGVKFVFNSNNIVSRGNYWNLLRHGCHETFIDNRLSTRSYFVYNTRVYYVLFNARGEMIKCI